ncbi:LtfC-like domain-containing protein [Mycolicibacter algericus]|uniref:LtfC/p132/Gp6 beta-sandwich domain-containing protein n=2 Tax=Mycolicibacter algericus TaxID=1288388 RepID=A0A7I9Y493_MYCAL|nr:hypothetical protein [Mycolicibacter algericus]OQZ94309.1 hypothetical protein BST10_18725 [Mycolicibacter algericus DSM 45454]GFG83397.1 hypothetical protein MALGJ_00730 [Mycolicibacter algericus]
MAIIYIVPRPAGARDDEDDKTRYVVSLTRNADCMFTIRAIDPDTSQPADWNCDVWVYVGLPGGKEQKVVATVTGSDAVVRIESEVGNQVKEGAAWQAVRSLPGSPLSLETPLMVGSFERADGGVPRV